MNKSSGHKDFEGRAVYEKMIAIFFFFKPVTDLKEIVHQDFIGYGTAAHEFFRNRMDVTEMAEMQSEQLRSQKVEIRRKPILERVFAEGTSCLILEEFDMYFKDTNHHLVARLSSIIERIDDKWLVTHFHGSTPDSNIAEDEAFPLEGLRKKNEELEAKIKERTRDLEIEAALERVRAKTMSIQHQDELFDVITLLADQLVHLGIDLDSANFSNGLSQKEGWDIWIYNKHFQPDMRTSRVFYPWFDHPMFHAVEALIEDYKKGIDLNVAVFDKEQLKVFVDYVFTETVYKDAEDKDSIKEAFHNVPGYTWTVICLKDTWVSMNRFNTTPFTDEENAIFRRFANAFGQAYTRFLDLQKAEAQAREALIETALEKVRSAMMAMHKSSELREVIKTIFLQLQSLNFGADASAVIIYDENYAAEHWFSGYSNETYPKSYTIPYAENFSYNTDLVDAWKDNVEYQAFPMEGKPKTDYGHWLLENTDFKDLPEEFTINAITSDLLVLNDAFNKYGMLEVLGPEKLSPVNAEILKRFSKVFEQTYTRFLDLQKAEVQAKEAQIELGLERVRARAMAMQNSNELSDLVATVLQELTKLDFSLTFCIINIYNEPDQSNTVWGASPEEDKAPESYYMKFEDYPFHDAMMREWKSQTQKYVYIIEGEEKKIYDDYLFTETEFRRFPKELQDANRALKRYVASFVFSPFGGLQVVGDQQLPDESLDILYRFGKVFDQTYTRFIDLQKAEAQAREAQVEAALERVRSRSLAMHKSEELNEVVAVIFEKLKELQIPATAVGIGIYIDGSKDLNSFVCGENKEGLVITNYRLPYFNNKISKDLCTAHEKQVDFFVGKYSKQVKNTFYQYILDHTPEFKQLPKDIKQMIFNSPSYTITMVVAKHAVFNINDFEGKTLSDEDLAIIKRVARVFDQTYTRFRDLQKAEAQTRAAQIEASLERVRAKSMAMHDSDELNDVLSVLFQQFDVLGIQPLTVFLSLFDIENNTFTYRSTSKAGTRMQSQQVVNLDALDIWKEMAEKWQNDTVDSIEEIYYPKAVLPDLFRLFEETFSAMPKKERLTATDFPDGGYAVHGYCKFGHLGFNHDRPGTEEEKNILLKFAKEFERVYQRFLDIQKAEAQTRQAQINLGVERVRAKALAMHKSEEIIEVVAKLKDEVMSLDIPDVIAATIFLKEGEDKVRMWDLSSLQKLDGVYQSPLDITFKLKKTDPHLYPKRVWENPDNYFVEIQDTKGFKRILAWLREHGKHEVANETEAFIEATQLKQLYHVAKKLTNGKLVIDLLNPPSAEMETILTKMGAAFDLAYKRFEDLQKAEAQAKEAQIEAALERVRSQSMGMHSADDLGGVTTEMFNQLRNFGEDLFATGIVFCDKHEGHVEQWHSIPKGGMLSPFIVPVDLDYIHQYRYDQWKKGERIFSVEIPSDFIEQHFEEIFKLPSAQIALKDLESRNAPMPKTPPWEIDYGASFKNGYILVSSLKPFENTDILQRFAQVFEQAYTRFLDLKKAEAQAREAKIEAALEKVRSRSLAMQTSNELQDVVQVVAEKIQELDVVVDSTGVIICTYPEDTKDVIHWTYTQDEERSQSYYMPYFEHPIWDEAWESKNSGVDYFSKTYPKGVKNRFLRTIFKRSDSGYSNLPEEYKQWQLNSPVYNLSFAWGKNSAILIPNNDGKQPNEEQKNILIRFAKVFEQSYVRFLDLQKAENQAREAQIEVSLERVRARAMAMHQTDELSDVICVLFDQFDILGINPVLTHLTLFDAENEIFSLRITTTAENRIVAEQHIDINAVDAWKDSYANWKKSDPNAIDCIDYPPEVIPMVWELLSEVMDALPKGHKIYPKDFPLGLYTTQGHFKFGYIGFNHKRRATEEEKAIVVRFAKEFGRTYQRFLDLQKAETQAREAEIEAALEKVRSKSLSMHKSDEMQLVADTIYEQLNALGFEMHAVAMSGEMDVQKGYEVWAGGVGMEKPLKIPYSEATKVQRDYNKVLLKRQELFTKTYTGNTKKEYINFLLSTNNFPAFLEKMMVASKAFTTTLASAKNSGLQVVRYTEEPYSEEDNTILIRFAKVFEQAYIRFLDLQKAESQAREAQIEAALERIRARSMAMHASDELSDVLEVLFNQFVILEINPVFAVLNLYDLDNDTFTMRVTGKNGAKVFATQTVKFSENETWKDYGEKFRQGNPEMISDVFYPVEILPNVWEILKDIVHAVPEEVRPLPSDFPNGLYNIEGYCKYGTIGCNLNRLPTEEEKNIVIKFATEFGRLYQRFLDIEKAETQAKEAEIELALERVRARTMAMHKSEELAETALVLYEQFAQLGNIPDRMSIGIFTEETGELTLWGTDQSGSKLNQKFTGSWKKSVVMTKIYNAWKAGDDFLVEDLSGQKLKVWLKFIREKMKLFVDDTHIKGRRVQQAAFFSHGFLLSTTNEPIAEEVMQLLVRFSKVFSQTYTRFLDLQKAEEQAREAKIEGALERVRSKTMAMHNSQDLEDIVISLFDEVLKLGIDKSIRCGIGILEGHEGMETRSVNKKPDGTVELRVGMLNMTIHPMLVGLKKAWKKGSKGYSYDYTEKDVRKYYGALNKEPEYPFNANLKKLPKQEFHKSFFYSSGIIFAFSENPISEEASTILARFAAVFGQTYRRFLDLQKAESQAMEAKIEMALERVRAHTMAMHNSEDVAVAVKTMFDQLTLLGLSPAVRCGIGTFDDSDFMELWTASKDPTGKVQLDIGTLDMRLHPLLIGFKKAYEDKQPFYEHKKLSGKEVREYFEIINNSPGYTFQTDLEKLPAEIYHYDFIFAQGAVFVFSPDPLPLDFKELFGRFTKVFQQTYTRYLDLQKAEAQAKESEIQLALERVRARTMAMHNSAELGEVAAVLFEQITNLSYAPDRFNIAIADEEDESFDIWITEQGGHQLSKAFMFKVNESPVVSQVFKAWKKKQKSMVQHLNGKELENWIRYVQEVAGLPIDKKHIKEERYISNIFFSHGCIGITTNEEPSTEALQLIGRFAQVFQQTYTRFLDLQKAEAQAMEAKIETALERVRAQTMAMHNSDDVAIAVKTMFDEVLKLGLDDSIRCGIGILEGLERMETWSANATSDGDVELKIGMLNMTIHPLLVGAKKAWEDGKKSYTYELKGADVRTYFSALNKEPDYQFSVDLNALPNRVILNNFYFSAGILFAFTENPINEEAAKVLNRFAGVFDQTYTRFLDLQKAEAQAREAEIELSLERIRAQAMAMTQSSDLLDIVVTMRSEFIILGHEAHYFWHMRWQPDGYEKAMTSGDGTRIGMVMQLPRDFHSHYTGMTEWENSKEPVMILALETEIAVDYIGKMITQGNFQQVDPNAPTLDDVRHIGGITFVMARTTHGEIGYSLPGVVKNPPVEDLNILERFAGVFDLAHRRFEDLIKAEAREKEAIKQSSLDRVRAEIASMRTTDDLDMITPLVWRELTTLGVPFFRCGIFIIREEEEMVHAYLSTPSGDRLAALHIGFDEQEVGLIQPAITNWRKQEIYSEEWDQERFIQNMGTFMKQGIIKSPKKYQDGETPPEKLVLQLVPFKQGMLYVGNSEQLIPEHIELMKELAKAFSVAYSRYEDFNELEQAKSKVEVALTDLKSTQNQLVQSEKMASLGELTAGIAHEIQNPLNFVNNFSEVSKELIEEMMEEMEKGDMEEVKAIADDVVQNLEKINHHGKRADGIVKGMLQHSRTSSGEKELTDINILADEYLRLAYHGLRAKDKSFNATLETHFDESIGKVQVATQDMGRVILNLITNAFYAVQEKKKQNPEGYTPTVTVSTEKTANGIFIKVRDNGNGIPEAIKEKIFQPFFTTKPTGQGTGLGLSMSYDIVTKGHGGNLKVETEEGKGTIFCINLPVSK